MSNPPPGPLLLQRLDVHDRKQVELKLELQPSGSARRARYRVELFFHVPGSLYINGETYPRTDVYADVHNYVRLKTPVLGFGDILSRDSSPLRRLERWRDGTEPLTEEALVSTAKLLACVVRGALRRFVLRVAGECGRPEQGEACPASLQLTVRDAQLGAEAVLLRFRHWMAAALTAGLSERTCTSLRLVDEYQSLLLEQFFRMVVADLEAWPRTGPWGQVRKELMVAVLREESYRRGQRLRSVLSPSGDNEEYMHRLGMLKKFCMQALFLPVQRTQLRQGYEEALFAIAAGVAMAVATAIGAWAQLRYEGLSLNLFLIIVAAYMMKDRAKEGLRRLFAQAASRHLFDRSWDILAPGRKTSVAEVREKVDYLSHEQVPPEVSAQRQADELVRAAAGELGETVIRYQKDVVVEVDQMPRPLQGPEEAPGGLTDIVRFNVDRLLRDMDEPEFALEYVDVEDFRVGRVRGAKSYRVDLACRFTCEEGSRRETVVQLARLVLDRNGIKRMDRVEEGPSPAPTPGPAPLPQAA